eukprot:CAMPEP_0174907214 /NCGR_PEP_ID=MMETSP0167-20121228/59936_1 /TAXON_ID=38298 /ORGANISM="Rhodella maculata, Strain CCMP736" /LENGTH=245 /DNA_ID=CAMNT_0016150639 /DNA_START=157 /DNA_END=896 /DNA_ORIENTATION=+
MQWLGRASGRRLEDSDGILEHDIRLVVTPNATVTPVSRDLEEAVRTLWEYLGIRLGALEPLKVFLALAGLENDSRGGGGGVEVDEEVRREAGWEATAVNGVVLRGSGESVNAGTLIIEDTRQVGGIRNYRVDYGRYLRVGQIKDRNEGDTLFEDAATPDATQQSETLAVGSGSPGGHDARKMVSTSQNASVPLKTNAEADASSQVSGPPGEQKHPEHAAVSAEHVEAPSTADSRRMVLQAPPEDS